MSISPLGYIYMYSIYHRCFSTFITVRSVGLNAQNSPASLAISFGWKGGDCAKVKNKASGLSEKWQFNPNVRDMGRKCFKKTPSQLTHSNWGWEFSLTVFRILLVSQTGIKYTFLKSMLALLPWFCQLREAWQVTVQIFLIYNYVLIISSNDRIAQEYAGWRIASFYCLL